MFGQKANNKERKLTKNTKLNFNYSSRWFKHVKEKINSLLK